MIAASIFIARCFLHFLYKSMHNFISVFALSRVLCLTDLFALTGISFFLKQKSPPQQLAAPRRTNRHDLSTIVQVTNNSECFIDRTSAEGISTKHLSHFLGYCKSEPGGVASRQLFAALVTKPHTTTAARRPRRAAGEGEGASTRRRRSGQI